MEPEQCRGWKGAGQSEEPLQSWAGEGCEADGASVCVCVCSVCCICHVLLSSQLGFSSCSRSKGKCGGSSIRGFPSPILPVFVPFSSAKLS